MRITSKHPVRAAIAGLPVYYGSKGSAMGAVMAALSDHDIRAEHRDMPGSDGFVGLPLKREKGPVVCSKCGDRDDYYDNLAIVCWYTMPSGRIELTAYIS